jgi:hypothetical protein
MGQAHGLALPHEKLDPELVLQGPDLAADRALGEVEFVGGGREAAGARCGFEGGQQGGGRQEAAGDLHGHSG